MSGKQKKILIVCSVIAAVIAIAAGVMTYLLDYYPVDREAAKAASSGYCYVVEYGDDLKAYEPVGETTSSCSSSSPSRAKISQAIFAPSVGVTKRTDRQRLRKDFRYLTNPESSGIST